MVNLSEYVTERFEQEANDLAGMMDRYPDKLTGKAACKIAGKRAAFREVLEWITDESKKVRG